MGGPPGCPVLTPRFLTLAMPQISPERLHQVPVRAGDLRLDAIDGPRQRRDYDHRHIAQFRGGPDPLAERDAAGIGQPQIEADQVGGPALEQGNGFSAGRSLVHAQP